MLARLVSANVVFGVHAIGQHDINDVNVRVVFDRVVILVVVNIFRADTVALRELVGFVGMAAHQSDDFRLLALGERGKNLVDGETSEANNGPAQLLAGRIGYAELRGSRL